VKEPSRKKKIAITFKWGHGWRSGGSLKRSGEKEYRGGRELESRKVSEVRKSQGGERFSGKGKSVASKG